MRPKRVITRRRPALESLESRSLLTAVLVSTTADSGPGSLRQAILDSNATPGVHDTISFAIPTSDPGFDVTAGAWNIRPATQLPEITDGLLIDGTSQPGYSAVHRPVVALDGAGHAFEGLVLSGGQSSVRGLAIGGFITGIHLRQQGSDTIEGCFIGTDATGLIARGNTQVTSAPPAAGVLVECAGNTIGGTEPGQGNLIAANDCGVRIVGVSATGNTVAGNTIGLDASGRLGVGNHTAGVYIESASSNTIGGPVAGARNVISGNAGAGVRIQSGVAAADNNAIQGNYIGTDATGTIAAGNRDDGVEVAAADTLITGNVVSANSDGVHIAGGLALAGLVHDNTVQGNFIGTDKAGMVALPNHVHGIQLEFSASNRIGGSDSGEGNLISGNTGHGIAAQSGPDTPAGTIAGNLIGTDITGKHALANGGDGIALNAAEMRIIDNVIAANGHNGITVVLSAPPGVTWPSNDVITGNFIGTDRDATAHLGNSGDGILVESGGNSIGGAEDGTGNAIAYNARNGVTIESGVHNAVLSNSIHDNGGIGIDLFPLAGPTPNDASGHVGANHGQNFPVIGSVVGNSDGITVTGSLDSTPATTFLVQFFASDVPSASGYGEGASLIGQANVTTDASGHATFDFTVTSGLTLSQFVTATATSPAGDTSEFSALVTDLAVSESAPAVVVQAGTALAFTTTVTNTGPSPSYQTVLTQSLPPGTVFVSATGGVAPQAGATSVEIPLGTIPVGATVTVTFVVKAAVPGAYTSTVSARNSVTDTDHSNDSATATASVVPGIPTPPPARADIGITEVASAGPRLPGEALVYTVNVANVGPDTATNVVVMITLPLDLTDVSVVGGARGGSAGAPYRYLLGDLPSGAHATLTISGKPRSSGRYTVEASASAAEIDPDASNNHAIAAATVVDPPQPPSPGPSSEPTPIPIPTPTPPTIVDGPVVVKLARFGYHTLPTTVVLTFSAALEPSRATNAGNYTIAGPDGRNVPVALATYDPSTRSVTLHPAHRLNAHFAYKLTVRGSDLTDLSGHTLDGAGTGRPGSDYVASIDPSVLVVTSPGPRANAAYQFVRRWRARHSGHSV